MVERLGPYELIDVVGQGGMGRVWRARDTRYGRIVALKVIADDKAQRAEFLELFHREAELVGRLNSPHIIPIHNYGEIDDQAYLDMRFVPGQPLSRLVRSRGPADVTTALAIIRQAASAVDDAHSGGVVHRDVKPANLLITDKGFVYLADFGIAVVEGGLPPEGAQILGSWGYMAPERFDARPQTGACDVYALGCVLHFALTGAAPFPGRELEELRDAHRYAPAPKLAGRVPGVSPQLDGVIAWALAKHPSDRPATANEWVTQLERVQANQSASVNRSVPGAWPGAGQGPGPRATQPGQVPGRAARPVGGSSAPRPAARSSNGTNVAMIALLVALAIVAGAVAAVVAGR